jgi:hypothetical protein
MHVSCLCGWSRPKVAGVLAWRTHRNPCIHRNSSPHPIPLQTCRLPSQRCKSYRIRRVHVPTCSTSPPVTKPGLTNDHVFKSSPDAPSHTTRCRALKADSRYSFKMRLSSLLSLSLQKSSGGQLPYSRCHPVPHHWRASSQPLTRNTRTFCPRTLRVKHEDKCTKKKCLNQSSSFK